MDTKDDAFLKRLLATFRVEAEEHLRALSAGLVELEQGTDPSRRSEVVEAVFRETHSFKGAARAVGKGDIEALCQGGEAVFAALKEGGIEISPALLDLLHELEDSLEQRLLAMDREPAGGERSAVADLRRRLMAVVASKGGEGGMQSAGSAPATAGRRAARIQALPHAQEGPAAAGPVAPQPAPRPALPSDAVPAATPAPRAAPGEGAGTVRIPVSRLDAVLFQAEALLGAKLAATQRAGELRAARAAFAQRQRERSRVLADVRALQRAVERSAKTRATSATADVALPQLRRVLEYMAGEDAFLRSFGGRLGGLERVAEQGARSLGGQVDGLLADVKQALMLPVSAAFEGMPKLVRDLAREQGKEVDFRASGGDVEIDRRILEELRDPLIHLLRNAVDHGIEAPTARQAAGKPPRGSLRIAAAQIEGNRIEIRVTDDGAGIDVDKLRSAARRLGLGGEGGSDGALLQLVFQSGVSTTARVTDISGRGLGLAIVHEKVERLGGAATVASEPGRGTDFRLVLPLTLATFHGVRVRAAGEEFIFPTIQLERVVRVRRGEIATIENREAIRLDGHAVALVRLDDVLELGETRGERPEAAPAVIVGSGERRIAFVVDEVIGEQEVLVKGLGRQLRRVRNVAGATVLGSGQVVPILYVPDLLKSARHAVPTRRAAEAPRRAPKSILVAEDSITSRMLLKGILESAGYRVTTAVDGVDAYSRLRTDNFDLLVSDVDMPRMSGLDLTARVRADPRLADLPVVLVTALGSQAERGRGAEVGANAYLVKSSFDQGNLLAVIRRLL